MPSKTESPTFVGMRANQEFAEAVRDIASLEDRTVSHIIKRALYQYVASTINTAQQQIASIDFLQKGIEQDLGLVERLSGRDTSAFEENIRSARERIESIDVEKEQEIYQTYSGILQRLKIAEDK